MKTETPVPTQVVHAPHVPLTDYYADEDARPGFVRNLFDKTAPDYDRIETLLAFGSGRWYRGQALGRAGLTAGMRVCDVGIGTGLVAREAIKLVGDPALIVGVDPSVGMMEQARGLGVQLVEGRAESIPFPDATFDFLSMGYALRHISDLEVAFREFRRVLKPGGRLCLLEITKPEGRIASTLLKAYMKGVVPVLARCVGASSETAHLWRYYWDTIEACAAPERVLATLEAVGFDGVRRHIETSSLSIFAEYQAASPAA